MDGGKEKQAKQVGTVNRVEQLIWQQPEEALPEDQQHVLFIGPRGLAMGGFITKLSLFVDEVGAGFLPEHVKWWVAVPVGPK